MGLVDLWRPYDKRFIADPYSFYESIREMAPVFQANTSDYVVLGYEDVKTVLQDKSCLTGVRAEWVHKLSVYVGLRDLDFSVLDKVVNGMLIQLNPPEHTELRSILAKKWPSKEELIQLSSEIADQLLVDLPEGKVDFVNTVTKKLPLYLICQILGIPKEDGEKLMKDGFQVVQLLDPYLTARELDKIEHAASRLFSYFQTHLQLETSSRLTKSVQKFVKKSGEEDKGTALLLFLFIAGFETTATLLTSCMQILLEDKTWKNELIDQPNIDRFVNEVLRIHNPVQLTGRVTTRSITLSGVEIPSGSVVTLGLGAANRDPNYFYRPDQIDLNRKKIEHLSFGYGMHHCLGNQMAQVEAVVLIEKLLGHIDRFSLVEDTQQTEKLTIRSVNQLFVQYN
jgi:cytochrome P450